MTSLASFASRLHRPLPAALAFAFAFALASCSRMPVEPVLSRSAGAPPAAVRSTGPATDGVIVQLVSGVTATSFASATNTTVLGTVPEIALALLRSNDGSSDSLLAARLQRDVRVRFAETNVAVEAAEARQSTFAFDEGNPGWPAVTDQGALTRVNAAIAQRSGTGAGVLVATLDTGIDLDHPALAPVLRLPGIEPGVTTDPGDDRPQSLDTNGDGVTDGALGHGTHVAGIVHAVAPGASLLAVRVLDSDGVGEAFAVARGIVLATDAGAAVVNASLGMPAPSQAVQAAIGFATTAGVVLVAPAGNAGLPQADFPGSAPGVVCVAGTDASDDRAAFSNYGAGVALAAPAVGIESTYWNGDYATWSGTSMAAPFVSGAAALLYGLAGPRSPAAAAFVKTLLVAGAVPLASVDPVYGAQLGAGRLDVAASVHALATGGGGGAGRGVRTDGN